jgi:hypothetical protein
MRETDLDRLLRDHGGLEGLARELGQYGAPGGLYEPPANANAPLRRLKPWACLFSEFRNLCRRLTK